MLFGGVACTPDNGEEVDTTSAAAISVNPEVLTTTLEGDTFTLTVTSNATWTVSCDQNDVVLSPLSGSKNGVVTVTVPAATVARTANVKFEAQKQASLQGISYTSTAEAIVPVYQNASGEVVEGGIATIKEAGTYEIEGAWVFATYAQGFLMTDKSGASILVYQGNGATVPAVGQVVNVSGAVSLYGGLLQFGKDATVSQVSGQTVNVATPSNPTVLDYTAIEAYVNAPSIFYAEIKGKMMVKDSGKGYNNYNIELEGGSAVMGSVSYPTTALANTMNAMADAYVVVRGYMIGKPNSNNAYANMMATSVEIDTTKPAIVATNISDVPAEGVTNATHSISVYSLSSVTATPDGAVVTAASVSGNVLTYSVAANTAEARQGSITLSGEGAESVTIKVAQLGAIESPEYNFMSDAALTCTANNSSNCVYTCKTKANGSEVENGNGFKLGKSSAAGVFTSTALGVTGDKTLEFYAVAWTGKKAKLYVRIKGATENLAVLDLAGNTGASGNAEPYSITFETSDYYTVQLTGLTADSQLEFSTSATYTAASDSSTSRALIVGAHIK